MKEITLEKARKFMAVAQAVAGLSKADTKVGALLVGPGHEILLSSYNGPVRGLDDDSDLAWADVFVKHAEGNLFLTAARVGVSAKGCAVVTTKAPCLACVADILQCGTMHLITPPPDAATRWTEQQRAGFEILHAAGVAIQVV